MITLIRKLSLQIEAAIARAEIAEVETASLRSKYAGKTAGAGPGGRKKLIKGIQHRLWHRIVASDRRLSSPGIWNALSVACFCHGTSRHDRTLGHVAVD